MSAVSATEVGAVDVSGAVPASHARLVRTLLRELQLRDPDGSRLDKVTDVAVLATKAAESALDTADVWAEHLGGFYDAATVGKVLSRGGRPVSRQAVHKRRGLLALTTGSGRVVYPAFQFVAGGVLPGLEAIQRAVPEELASRWTLASWLVSPQPELGGQSPVQLLREGGVGPALTAARDWASSLAV
jgi:hypothetical protein